jgi:hypothetical protein
MSTQLLRTLLFHCYLIANTCRPEEYARWKSEERQDYLHQMGTWEDAKLRFDGFSDCIIALDFSLVYVSDVIGCWCMLVRS